MWSIDLQAMLELKQELIEYILMKWPYTNVEYLADCSADELIAYATRRND